MLLQELTKGGKLQALVNRSKELAHDLVKAKTLVDFKVGSIDEEVKKVQGDEDALALVSSHSLCNPAALTE